MNDVATRADRLGVHVLMFGLVREEPRDAVRSLAVVPLLMPEEIDLFCTGDEEDLALSNACLEAEAALRDREWAALERLLGLVAAGEGELDERVWRLPDWAFRPAARALYQLGWLSITDESEPPPEEWAA